MLRFGPPPHGVLDHHYRAVDDQAEVEGAEAHQVSRHVENAHQDRRKEHRERDDRRDQQRAAPVAEQQDQHDDDQQPRLRPG